MNETKNQNFYRVPYLQIFAPGAALWWFQTYQNHFPSRLSWQNWTWHICQVWKPSKTAVALLDGVTISSTPCSQHFTVTLGADALTDHVVQAWANPSPFWGLLSQWHRQKTTTPETNGASSARTQRHFRKIPRFVRQRITQFHGKGV